MALLAPSRSATESPPSSFELELVIEKVDNIGLVCRDLRCI